MCYLTAPADEEMCHLLTTSVRNEIVHDLVTQMFAIQTMPDRAFCTTVAKALVKKYPRLNDKGKNVTGYVSPCMCTSTGMTDMTRCIHALVSAWFTLCITSCFSRAHGRRS